MNLAYDVHWCPDVFHNVPQEYEMKRCHPKKNTSKPAPPIGKWHYVLPAALLDSWSCTSWVNLSSQNSMSHSSQKLANKRSLLNGKSFIQSEPVVLHTWSKVYSPWNCRANELLALLGKDSISIYGVLFCTKCKFWSVRMFCNSECALKVCTTSILLLLKMRGTGTYCTCLSTKAQWKLSLIMFSPFPNQTFYWCFIVALKFTLQTLHCSNLVQYGTCPGISLSNKEAQCAKCVYTWV